MNQQLKTYLDQQADALDEDVRQALELCGGNALSALCIALIANAFLTEENEKLKAQVSKGYVRRNSR